MTVNEMLKNKDTFDENYSTISLHDAEEAMIEFAKHHVKQALKFASYKAKAFNKPKFGFSVNPQVDIESILNTYSLENIK